MERETSPFSPHPPLKKGDRESLRVITASSQMIKKADEVSSFRRERGKEKIEVRIRKEGRKERSREVMYERTQVFCAPFVLRCLCLVCLCVSEVQLSFPSDSALIGVASDG